MSQSLLTQLPEIIAGAWQAARQVLSNLGGSTEGSHSNGYGREWVIAEGGAALPNTAIQYNRLVCGDNLHVMAALLTGDAQTPSLRGKIDLIYIDPPFASQADYHTKTLVPEATPAHQPMLIRQLAYADRWSEDATTYLAMLTPRLILMRELLSDRGSIYVHLDWRMAHYVRLVMDEIFGKSNFQNEIVWHYRRWSAAGNKYQRMHDKLLFYTKTARYYFNKTHVEARPSQQAAIARGYNVNTVNSMRGKIRQLIVYDQDKVDRLVQNKKIDPARYDRIVRVDAKASAAPDVWTDIQFLHARSRERTHYPTQKPEKLLARIVETSCPPDGLVADFFGGSGTAAAVAEKFGRRWISVDSGKPACLIMRKRLLAQSARPFLYERFLLGEDCLVGHAQDSLRLPLLSIRPVVRQIDGERESLTVSLAGYTSHLSAVGDPVMNETHRKRLQAAAHAEPLALIDYWAIDPDCADSLFRAVWHDYRGRANSNRNPLRVVTQTTLNLPRKHGPRKLCVRAIDIFGFETEVSVSLEEVI